MVVTDVSMASAAVIFRVTLKMTAAEAVETSDTTINSLSQDFTNLDDQPSQTLTDTPGFKPFTLPCDQLQLLVTLVL